MELETKEKFDVIVEFFKDENTSVEPHFIGAHKNETGEWNWINGGEHSYKVEFGLLNAGDEKDSCLQYSAGTSYSVVPCSDTVAQLVCQKTTSSH